MKNYKALAAAIIETAVEDYLALPRINQTPAPDLVFFAELRRTAWRHKKKPIAYTVKKAMAKNKGWGFARAIVMQQIKKGRQLNEAPAQYEITAEEALSSVKFFDSAWFLTLCNFLKIDADYLRTGLRDRLDPDSDLAKAWQQRGCSDRRSS